MSDDTKSETNETEETKSESPPPRRNRGWVRYIILVLVLGVGGYWGFQEVHSRFTQEALLWVCFSTASSQSFSSKSKVCTGVVVDGGVSWAVGGV